MSRPGNIVSMCLRNFESIAMMSSKWPCWGQSLTIQIWPSRSMICALISPIFSLMSSEGSITSMLRIRWRASMTHFGQSESVVRGKPSGGFDFCHDLRMGLSDHFGVKGLPGRYWLKNWTVLKRPPATAVSPFSAYLIGFILGFLLSFSADARWSTGAAYLMHTKFIKTVLMPRSLEFASLILLLPV